MKSRHDEIRRKYGKGLGVPVPAGRVPPGVSVIVTLQEAVGRAAGSPGTEVPLLHKVVLSRADITDPTQCPEGRGWAVGLSQTSLRAPRAHEAQRHDPRGPPPQEHAALSPPLTVTAAPSLRVSRTAVRLPVGRVLPRVLGFVSGGRGQGWPPLGVREHRVCTRGQRSRPRAVGGEGCAEARPHRRQPQGPQRSAALDLMTQGSCAPMVGARQPC